MQIEKTCFFTGHRRLPSSFYEQIRDLLKTEIIKKYDEGIRDFITGGAWGFDTMAAEMVIYLKENYYHDMRLLLYLPCKDFGEDWPYEQRCALHRIKCKADWCQVITDKAYTDTCMKKRNEAMVLGSCCGIAFKTSERTGTSQTVLMAQKQNKPVVNIARLLKKDVVY